MFRKILTGALIIFPLLLCGVSRAETTGVTARYLSLSEKKTLEANIETYQLRIDELEKDLQNLEAEREWLYLRSMRFTDRGKSVPFPMKKREQSIRARIAQWEMEKERLTEFIGNHLKRHRELAEEVKKRNNGKLPAWWHPDPYMKRYAPEEKPAEKVEKKVPENNGPKPSGLKKEIAYKVRTTGIDQWVELSTEKGALKLETRLPILFGTGKSTLSKEYGRFFKKLAGVLKPYPVKIEVEGFADRSRGRGKRSPSNFELGAKRADSVVRTLVRYGMDPSVFTIRSRGEYGGESGKKKDPMMRRAQVTVYFPGSS